MFRTNMRPALVLAFVVPVLACSKNAEPPHDAAAHAPAPVTPGLQSRIADDLPMLQANINRGARPTEVVRAAYEFAARHPEVLKFVPCFCGCERGGHQGNHDCFVAARDAQGKVSQWDTHGLVCEICIDVAQEAMMMHNSGASVAAIREAIDKRYADLPTRTPTPKPAARGTKGSRP
jgi:hypothetical protein